MGSNEVKRPSKCTCPECGHQFSYSAGSNVVSSSKTLVERNRVCTRCKKAYETVEITKAEYNMLVAIAEKEKEKKTSKEKK